MITVRKHHPPIEPATPPTEPVRWIGVAWRADGQTWTIGRQTSADQATVTARTAHAAREQLVRAALWRDVAPQDLIVEQLADEE